MNMFLQILNHNKRYISMRILGSGRGGMAGKEKRIRDGERERKMEREKKKRI